MHTAQLVINIDNEAISCAACQWRCVFRLNDTGRCLMRVRNAEGIELLNYGLISAAAVGPIEGYRLWHFFPDSKVLAIGSWGYAFPADHQRSPYARLPPNDRNRRYLDAERAANFALEKLCRGVVWAFGEPAVSYEYVLDLLRLSRAASRYTALVTNAYLTPEALDGLGPYLDGICLDLRGFSDASYSRLGGVPEWRGILDVAVRARQHWHCHVEVLTRLHHDVNDDIEELRALVGWIRDGLGVQTPWHILPGDAGAKTAASVARARRIAHESGLHFIYGPEVNQPTRCPFCQYTLITRENGVARIVGISSNTCEKCMQEIYLRTSLFKPR
ncbi:MAG: radical SAM protein [Chloroflexales bacterium]|nr:radical SAM protein [Chloroflexales bacterium]